MKRVWPDAFVEEGNLNKNIFVLRKLLGEWHDGGSTSKPCPNAGIGLWLRPGGDARRGSHAVAHCRWCESDGEEDLPTTACSRSWVAAGWGWFTEPRILNWAAASR